MSTANRRSVLQGATSLALCAMSAPALGVMHTIEYELVLFIDCSSSMYGDRSTIEGRDSATPNWLIQRDGHLMALREPDIMNALISNRVFVRVVLWAEEHTSTQIFAESIDSETQHARLIDAILLQTPHTQIAPGTVHLECLQFILDTPRVAQTRRTSDICTDDSLLTVWRKPTAALRDQVALLGQEQVNVLSLNHPKSTAHLRAHLQTPNGFTFDVDNYNRPISLASFTACLRRKLQAEVAWLTGRRFV